MLDDTSKTPFDKARALSTDATPYLDDAGELKFDMSQRGSSEGLILRMVLSIHGAERVLDRHIDSKRALGQLDEVEVDVLDASIAIRALAHNVQDITMNLSSMCQDELDQAQGLVVTAKDFYNRSASTLLRHKDTLERLDPNALRGIVLE